LKVMPSRSVTPDTTAWIDWPLVSGNPADVSGHGRNLTIYGTISGSGSRTHFYRKLGLQIGMIDWERFSAQELRDHQPRHFVFIGRTYSSTSSSYGFASSRLFSQTVQHPLA
jgi:hypothetical protein